MKHMDGALEASINETSENIYKYSQQHPSAVSTLRDLLHFWRDHYQSQRTSFDFFKLVKGAHFAALKHEGQSRNHREEIPYIIHPLRVAALLWREGGIRDEEILLAALLHDTLEDTKTSLEEIVEAFGKKVASLVQELTIKKGLGFEEELECYRHVSQEAKIIRLADRTHNLQDILEHPPKIWKKDKIEQFLLKSYYLLQVLRGTHVKLEESYAVAMEKVAGYVPVNNLVE